MPPKAKFTREEIVSAALEIVRADGALALTARALGARLGSSPRPIFTVFESMEEVFLEVRLAAKRIYASYVDRGLSEEIAFKGVGKQYILFAIKEPKLFQLLFMEEQENVPSISGVLPLIEENYDRIVSSVQEGYGLDSEAARKLYRHLWIYTHGIAALCATRMCSFTAEEIGSMMTEVFKGLLNGIKEGKND